MPETEDDRRLAALLKFHTLDCAWGLVGMGGERWGVLAVSGPWQTRAEDGSGPPPPPPFSLPPAYEDKQKLKRTEIISRSWFPSASGPGSGSSSISGSSKAGGVLKKLAQNRRSATAGGLISVGDLGIVRRQSREISESPQHAAESGEPQVLEGTTQDRPTSPQDCLQEIAKTSAPQEQDGSCQDRPWSPAGSSQEAPVPQDMPHPCTLSSSLVADYSDSESE